MKTFTVMLASLMLLSACKDKPQLPNVKAPPGAAPPGSHTAPATTQAENDLADMEPLPRDRVAIFDVGPGGSMWQKFPDGLCIQELKVGIGREPDYGQTVWLSYVARLADGRTEVDRVTKDKPLHFRVGSKKTIRGLSLGVLKMRLGGERRIYIPPELAFGREGNPDKKIAPDTPLIYDIKLLQITGDPIPVPGDTQPALPGMMGPPAPAATAPVHSDHDHEH